MDLTTQIQALQAMACNLGSATSVREKVKLADHIFEVLSECEKLVEGFIVTELSTTNGSNRNHQVEKSSAQQTEKPTAPIVTSKRFKGMTLADVGRILLKESAVLHGKEIETLAKGGGFK